MEQIKNLFVKTTTQSILAIIIFVGGGFFITFAKATESVNASILNLMMICAGYYFGASKNETK